MAIPTPLQASQSKTSQPKLAQTKDSHAASRLTENNDAMSTKYPARNKLKKKVIAAKRVLDGRRRYSRALKVAIEIARSYRHFKHQQKTHLLHDELTSDHSVRSDLKKLHSVNAKKVASLCSKNGATWIKIAQVLSCRPDILPREYIEELKSLQNDAPSVEFSQLIPVLIENFGIDWESKIRSIDPKPIATASLAQVHRAVLNDGRDVAIKIQLPGVLTLFKQDFVTFRLLSNVLAPFISQLDVQQITHQLLDMTKQELDFCIEAENLKKFSAFKHHARIKFPDLIEELSNSKILVTQWIDGLRLREFLDQHPDQANDLLTLLLDSYIQQITQFGVYHADPHPGNFIVNDNREITILDFGALGSLSPSETLNYSALLFSLLRRSDENLEKAFHRAGFKGIDEATFRELSKIFLGNKNPDADYTELLAESIETLRQHHITIPDSFVSLARVLVTVGGFMQTYRVKLKLTEAFENRRSS